jgi:hypothetical protein
MIVWTMFFITLVANLASIHLVVVRMILLFFPTMGEAASILISACLIICADKVFAFPIWTLIFSVREEVRFSSEVLPVMSEYT